MATNEELQTQIDTLKSRLDSYTLPSHATVVNQMSALTTSWQGYVDAQLRLGTGNATEVITTPPGQPEPGYYPLVDPAGLVTWHPSNELLKVKANSLVFERRALTSGTTHTLVAADGGKTLMLAGTTGTSNITCRLPGTVSAGWCVNVIQEGSGAPRITFTIGTNSAGDTAFLRQRGGVYRTAGQYALATAICVSRDSSSRSTIVLGGDLIA